MQLAANTNTQKAKRLEWLVIAIGFLLTVTKSRVAAAQSRNSPQPRAAGNSCRLYRSCRWRRQHVDHCHVGFKLFGISRQLFG
jgi:hypothetical protein